MTTKAAKAAKYQRLVFAASNGNARLAANKTKGRHVKATTNLTKGTTVFVETAAAFALLKHAIDERCLYCCSELESDSVNGKINLLGGTSSNSSTKIKCPNCIKQTFYCSQECLNLDAPRHLLECKIVRDLPGITAAAKVDYTLMRLVLAVLVQRHLENIGENHGENTHTDLVFDLLSHRKTCDPKWLACVEACAEDFASHLPTELAIPVSDIVSLACRINSNSHGIIDPTGNTNGEVGVGMFPLVAMLNHSCAPNCSFVSSTHGIMIVRTLCPVQEGQELCVSYVDLCTPRDERRDTANLDTNDSHLDAILCTSCSSCNAFHDSLQEFQCTLCSNKISKDQHTSITHAAESSHNNAHDLFRARHNDSAITAFQQFLSDYKSMLHPGHSLFLNAYATMTSAYMRVRDFPGVVKYGRLSIKTMSQYVPQNWPELADFRFRQAEMMEILGRVVGEGVISVEEARCAFDDGVEDVPTSEKDELSRFILGEALIAFETCLEMRRVAYGDGHVRTQEVASQVDRLRRDVSTKEE
ncbi:UNVERIFIED_CONTAM: hypothetical protein HDU68_007698 [Siphonaria sp. JEL0065]|nr:hypothetical protein HDU68_007698 [Siphonaria sp. JEL0065]